MSCKLDSIEGYTHRKRPYYAKAVQLTENNKDHVIELTKSIGGYATRFGDQLMVRFDTPRPRQYTPDTMSIGDWIVEGENGVSKVYTDEAFKVKYEELGE
jgi:hypothetical protein